MSYKYMTISIKLYICKYQEKNVQHIIHRELLSQLMENNILYINPVNTKHPSFYEKYETKNESIVVLYISIPIIIDKKKLLTQKTGYNYITRNLFSSKYIAKYLQNTLSHRLFWHMYNHPDINMKSTSLKYLHVNPL